MQMLIWIDSEKWPWIHECWEWQWMTSEIINEEFGLYISQREKPGADEIYGHVLKKNKLIVFSHDKRLKNPWWLIIGYAIFPYFNFSGNLLFCIKGFENSSYLKDRLHKRALCNNIAKYMPRSCYLLQNLAQSCSKPLRCYFDGNPVSEETSYMKCCSVLFELIARQLVDSHSCKQNEGTRRDFLE